MSDIYRGVLLRRGTSRFYYEKRRQSLQGDLFKTFEFLDFFNKILMNNYKIYVIIVEQRYIIMIFSGICTAIWMENYHDRNCKYSRFHPKTEFYNDTHMLCRHSRKSYA